MEYIRLRAPFKIEGYVPFKLNNPFLESDLKLVHLFLCNFELEADVEELDKLDEVIIVDRACECVE